MGNEGDHAVVIGFFRLPVNVQQDRSAVHPRCPASMTRG